MPLPGARYRVKTTDSGKKIRLAFVDGQVKEAVNLQSGATHSPADFKRDRKRKGARLKAAMLGGSSHTSNAMR